MTTGFEFLSITTFSLRRRFGLKIKKKQKRKNFLYASNFLHVHERICKKMLINCKAFYLIPLCIYCVNLDLY